MLLFDENLAARLVADLADLPAKIDADNKLDHCI
jgi:hypothetical protein